MSKGKGTMNSKKSKKETSTLPSHQAFAPPLGDSTHIKAYESPFDDWVICPQCESHYSPEESYGDVDNYCSRLCWNEAELFNEERLQEEANAYTERREI